MILEGIVAGQILAPIISAIVVTILYHYVGAEYLGADENKYWNTFRRVLLSEGDGIVRRKTKFTLTNAASEDGFVGTVDLTSNELAHKLEEAGYAQCVLSGLKYRPPNADPSDAEYEKGAMALRESKSDLLPDALALRQNHIYWFENDDGTLDVYAHYEYSSLNPLVAWKHYRTINHDAGEGARLVKKHTDLF